MSSLIGQLELRGGANRVCALDGLLPRVELEPAVEGSNKPTVHL